MADGVQLNGRHLSRPLTNRVENIANDNDDDDDDTPLDFSLRRGVDHHVTTPSPTTTSSSVTPAVTSLSLPVTSVPVLRPGLLGERGAAALVTALSAAGLLVPQRAPTPPQAVAAAAAGGTCPGPGVVTPAAGVVTPADLVAAQVRAYVQSKIAEQQLRLTAPTSRDVRRPADSSPVTF